MKIKCPKCSSELIMEIASKVRCKKCRILTDMTTIITVQCDKCRHVFQLPAKSRSFISIKKTE
jgi:RNase P subunit RPR2